VTVERGKLVDAAARVYGEFGFRGATTRRIADEAGVNEITIFRQFGSKEALINEAVRTHAVRPPLPDLPVAPVDPLLELSEWADTVRAHMSDARSLIRRMMSEMEERPLVAPCVGEGPMRAASQLRDYVARLRTFGFLPPVESSRARGPARAAGSNGDGHGPTTGGRASNGATTPDAADAASNANAASESASAADAASNAHAAASMLMSALFADAMGRDMMPMMYPQPAERAAAAYVKVFLRALGARSTSSHTPAPPPPLQSV
jgi:AcrR family transcriptional regulator